MSKRNSILLLILVLFLGGCWWIFSNPELRPVVISVYEGAIIQPDEKIHDLGDIVTDSKADHTFYLHNVGGARLVINRVETSCGCTVAKLEKKILQPGDVATVKVSVDTSIKLGKMKKKITIFSNDPKQPKLALYLKANVLPQMSGHDKIAVKDPLVLFKGECAKCHVQRGKGKTGKALFQADCAMCHGMYAQGGVAPSLVDRDYENEEIQKHIRTIISDGSPNTPEMAPFSEARGGPLNEAQIDSLVSYLQYQAGLAKQGIQEQEEEEEDETVEAL